MCLWSSGKNVGSDWPHLWQSKLTSYYDKGDRKVAFKIKVLEQLGGLADSQLSVSTGCVNVCPGKQQERECPEKLDQHGGSVYRAQPSLEYKNKYPKGLWGEQWTWAGLNPLIPSQWLGMPSVVMVSVSERPVMRITFVMIQQLCLCYFTSIPKLPLKQ